MPIYYTVAAKSRVEHLYWSSPPNWSAYALAEHLDGVLPYGGGTRLDRPMRRSPAWPKPGAWAMPKGIRWVVLYAPTLSRVRVTSTIFRDPRKRYTMNKYKKSLFMQDSPSNSSNPRSSHRFKFKRKWRKTLFRLAFRALEVLLVILQIIQCFCEMFKK